MPSKARNYFVDILLIMVAAVVIIRLLSIVVIFDRHYLDPDFSDFYTAGQAANAGLSIYVNNIFHHPPIWDGATLLTRSGFLYPPLASIFFRPLAMLPYLAAKFIWSIITLACVSLTMVIAARIDKKSLELRPTMMVIILVALFEPFLALLEQGQIDGVTLILMVGAIALMMRRGKIQSYSAGGLIAFAVLLKIQCILFLPFLLLRRRWQALTGVIAIGAILVILMLIVNGWQVTKDYAENRLPHFENAGQSIDKQDLPFPRGYKDGRLYYIPSNVAVAPTATLVVATLNLVKSANNLQMPKTTLSLIFFFIMFGIVAYWQMRHQNVVKHFSDMQEFAYWQIGLIIVLLCGPLTWVMNVVWILPAAFISIYWYKKVENGRQAFFLALSTLGLLLAAIPGEWGFMSLFPQQFHPEFKYIIAELMLFAGLLYFISHKIPENGHI